MSFDKDNKYGLSLANIIMITITTITLIFLYISDHKNIDEYILGIKQKTELPLPQSIKLSILILIVILALKFLLKIFNKTKKDLQASKLLSNSVVRDTNKGEIMEKSIILSSSPDDSQMVTVDKLVLHLVTPFSKKSVTILCNPILTEYTESLKPLGFNVKQIKLMVEAPDTKTLKFDFGKNNIKTINIDDISYTLKLMNINKEKTSHQKSFLTFEFFISG